MLSRKNKLNLVFLAAVCAMAGLGAWYANRTPPLPTDPAQDPRGATRRESGTSQAPYAPGQPLRLDADPAALTKTNIRPVSLGAAKAEATQAYFAAVKQGRAQFWEAQRRCQAQKLSLNEHIPPAVVRCLATVDAVPTKGVDPRLVAWGLNYRAGMVQLAQRLQTGFGQYAQCFQALEQLDAQFPQMAGAVDDTLGTALAKEGLGDVVALKSSGD